MGDSRMRFIYELFKTKVVHSMPVLKKYMHDTNFTHTASNVTVFFLIRTQNDENLHQDLIKIMVRKEY